MSGTTSDLELDSIIEESRLICDDASAVLNQIPSCDPNSVECSLRKLNALTSILSAPLLFQANALQEEIIQELIEYIMKLAALLEEQIPDTTTRHPETQQTSNRGRGRPSYQLNIASMVELHDLGISWEDIAKSVGVVRRRIYNHLVKEGIPTSRPAYTNISDEDLDIALQRLVTQHPFSGVYTLKAHLERINIVLPVKRVNESLRRVDADGIARR